MAETPKLILASTSPRRRELLARAGLEFEMTASGVTETRVHGESVPAYALRIAREKALAVARIRAEGLVLAADTIVECEGTMLEKPDSPDDARRMLGILSGRTHTVITAFALAQRGEVVESEAITSRVTFRPLEAREIDAYIATGEPLDKAGAYGIQGLAAGFISKLEGSRDNVMGLPTREVIAALARYGVRARRNQIDDA